MTKLVLTRTSISAQVFPVLVAPAHKLSMKFFDKLTDILHGAGISVTNLGRQIEFDKKDRTRVVDAVQEMGWKQRAKIPAGMTYQLPGKEWIIRISPTRLDLVGTKEISNPFAGDKGVTIEKAFDAFSVIVKLGANEKEANDKLKEIGFKNGKRDLLTVNHMYKNGTALIGAEQTDAGASSSPVKLPALKPAATRIEGDAKNVDKFIRDNYMVEGATNGLDRAAMAAPAAPAEGEVLVEVIGLTGSGKSAICGEIEILCRALGLDVSWPDGDPEKNMTHAEWTAAIEAYKPRVRIVERNVPRQSNGGPAK